MVEACQLESCFLQLIANAWRVLVLFGSAEADSRRLGNKPPSFGGENKSPLGLEVRSASFLPLFLLQTLFYLSIATGRRWITMGEDISNGVKEEWWLATNGCAILSVKTGYIDYGIDELIWNWLNWYNQIAMNQRLEPSLDLCADNLMKYRDNRVKNQRQETRPDHF